MLKRLIVMRHAKSSWKTDASNDHERPLNKRGRRDAPQVARQLLERGWGPEFILSSDAERTRETCARMLEELGDVPAEFTGDLYLAGLPQIAAGMTRVPDGTERVLVLGHNPGWENAAARLSGQPIVLKTAYAALLEREAATWPTALEPGTWTLRSLVTPPPRN